LIAFIVLVKSIGVEKSNILSPFVKLVGLAKKHAKTFKFLVVQWKR